MTYNSGKELKLYVIFNPVASRVSFASLEQYRPETHSKEDFLFLEESMARQLYLTDEYRPDFYIHRELIKFQRLQTKVSEKSTVGLTMQSTA